MVEGEDIHCMSKSQAGAGTLQGKSFCDAISSDWWHLPLQNIDDPTAVIDDFATQ